MALLDGWCVLHHSHNARSSGRPQPHTFGCVSSVCIVAERPPACQGVFLFFHVRRAGCALPRAYPRRLCPPSRCSYAAHIRRGLCWVAALHMAVSVGSPPPLTPRPKAGGALSGWYIYLRFSISSTKRASEIWRRFFGRLRRSSLRRVISSAMV